MSEIKPIRIQRSRKRKQVSPNGLPIVYVGRPSKYGNEFKIRKGVTLEDCYILHRVKFIKMSESEVDKFTKELKGKNLSCWCPLDVNCHADTLLELANK